MSASPDVRKSCPNRRKKRLGFENCTSERGVNRYHRSRGSKANSCGLPGAGFFPSIVFRVRCSTLVDVWVRARAAVAKWISSTAIMTSNDLSSKFGPLPRVLTWAKRYGAAEVTGTLTAYLGYFTMLGMTQNDVASAYGGSIGESLGFFGVMIIREAELLDTGLIGPLAMGTASYYLGPGIGILVGKLASDLAFSCWLSPKAPSPCSRPPSCAKSRLRKRRNLNSQPSRLLHPF